MKSVCQYQLSGGSSVASHHQQVPWQAQNTEPVAAGEPWGQFLFLLT